MAAITFNVTVERGGGAKTAELVKTEKGYQMTVKGEAD